VIDDYVWMYETVMVGRRPGKGEEMRKLHKDPTDGNFLGDTNT
jgi:hypothetical protein